MVYAKGLALRICALGWLFGACQPTSLSAHFSGCPVVDEGPVCVVERDVQSTVFIWLQNAALPVEVTLDGAPLDHTAVAHTTVAQPSGVRIALSVSKPGRLIIDAEQGRFTLPFLTSGRARPETVQKSAAARAHLGGGEWSQAVQLFSQTAPAHAQAGAWSRAVRDAQAAAYALVYIGHQPGEAQRYLDQAEPWLSHYPEGWALQPFYRALIALASADPAGAIAGIRKSKARLAPFASAQRIGDIEQTEAFALQKMGRTAEAQAILRKLSQADDISPCSKARRLNNAAWNGLLEADAHDRPAGPLVVKALEKARMILERGDCPSWPGHDLLWLHLSLSEVLANRFNSAQKWLARAAPQPQRLDAQLWTMALKGRIALGQGRPRDALRVLDEALQAAEQSLTFDAAWRLHTRRAQALDAMDAKSRALSALQEAEATLDDVMLQLPLGEGRGAFLADRARSAQMLAQRHLSADRPSEAACVLRRARARGLARAARMLKVKNLSPKTRSRWTRVMGEIQKLRGELETNAQTSWQISSKDRVDFERSQRKRRAQIRDRLTAALTMIESEGAPTRCEDLRPPAAGELVLSFHTIGENTPGEKTPSEPAVGFAITKQGTRAHRFDFLPTTASAWLAPFDAELHSATRVRLIAGGPTKHEALHSAPWRAQTLNRLRTVVYSLDLPRQASAHTKGHAVIVSDARRNLAGARVEGQMVRRALSARWKVQVIEGQDATAPAVRSAIEHAKLFHFAGHAQTEDAPFDDHLELHQGALYARDVLMLQRAPRWVVLTGCKTSVIRPDDGAGLSLAHAFLLSGAEQVLATTADVPDRLARKIGAQLYATPSEGELDLGRALKGAIVNVERPKVIPFQVWVR